MLKKFFLSALVIGIFTIYALHTNLIAEENRVVAIRTSPPGLHTDAPAIPVATLGPTPPPVRTATMAPTQPPIIRNAGRYKSGTYTGSVADAFYGNVQVQVTISGGKITDVKFLQYPNDRGTSRMINSQAMPLLTQEAIQAQSALVDGVSGATATSGAFIESLSSALQQAS